MHFISQATSPSPARDSSPSRDYPKPWMAGSRYTCFSTENNTVDNYSSHQNDQTSSLNSLHSALIRLNYSMSLMSITERFNHFGGHIIPSRLALRLAF